MSSLVKLCKVEKLVSGVHIYIVFTGKENFDESFSVRRKEKWRWKVFFRDIWTRKASRAHEDPMFVEDENMFTSWIFCSIRTYHLTTVMMSQLLMFSIIPEIVALGLDLGGYLFCIANFRKRVKKASEKSEEIFTFLTSICSNDFNIHKSQFNDVQVFLHIFSFSARQIHSRDFHRRAGYYHTFHFYSIFILPTT